jgi:pyruvate,water dikinase
MYEVPRALEIMKEEGLERGKNTQVYLMAETTPVLFYPERFMNYCDGYSIGSNDATQAILNIDRDNERFTRPILINSKGEKVPYFDETHPDVMDTFRRFITIAKQYKKKTGICGEAPTTKPDDYPAFLYECGIDSISVSSDTWPLVKKLIYFEEMKRLNPEAAGFGYGYWAYNIDAWNSKKFEKKIEKMKQCFK